MIISRTITETGYEVFFSGIVTSDEMFDVGEDFKRHPDFVRFQYILMWFTGIENMLIGAEQVQTLAYLDKKASKINPNIRFAIASDSLLVFGLARMWETYYGENPWVCMVFRELGEARKWARSG